MPAFLAALYCRRVPERQLQLFATRSVLCERFDSAFFQGIPRSPGVYFMSGARDRLLYVGKARDLRARVGSYRYVCEDCSRKTARLVARVARIRWEICASEEAALLEENRLLRELRPRFNRMNTWPKAYRFIRIEPVPGGTELRLTPEDTGECYGAFKGASRPAFGALLRLLAGMNAPYENLPRRLLCEPAPAAFIFAGGLDVCLQELRDFLHGQCDRLLRLQGEIRAQAESAFHVAFRAADVEAAEHFFRVGPQRNHVLRKRRGTEGRLIAPEELDDWIVRGREVINAAP